MPSTTCTGPDRHRLIWPTTYTACPRCGSTILPPGSKLPTPTTPPIPLPPPSGSTGGGSSSSSSFPTPYPGPPSAPVPGPTPPLPPVPTAGRKGGPVSAYGPLPINVPARSPDIEGHISSELKRETVGIPLDWSDIFLRIVFLPFVWPFLIKEFFRVGPSSKRSMTVYNVRIDTLTGTEEVIIEGDPAGSRPALRDNVSLWVKSRSGQYIVTHGYNHKTGKLIASRPPVRWPTRAVAFIILALFLLIFVLCAMASNYHP